MQNNLDKTDGSVTIYGKIEETFLSYAEKQCAAFNAIYNKTPDAVNCDALLNMMQTYKVRQRFW